MAMIQNITKSTSGTILLDGKELDVPKWTVRSSNKTGVAVSAMVAFKQLSKQKSLRHLVVGIIGPRDATDEQFKAAESVAYQLGGLGITLICGGKSGVMEAASKGCKESGGLLIGILPGSIPSEANDFVGIPLPTGLGEARNMIIAKSARVLIAVGGSHGTLSEVAYGLHFSKPVIGLAGAADVEGVVHVKDSEAAANAALEALLLCATSPVSEQGCKISYKAGK
jgi:uncharacterized protein (TIGR00725 family)